MKFTMMKFNLTNSQSIDPAHPLYLPPGPDEEKDCLEIAPESPHYRCTRIHEHFGDCAAHPNQEEGNSSGGLPVMFARWSKGEKRDVKGDRLCV